MRHPALPLVALGCGVLLVASSYAWLSFAGGSGAWTEEDELAYVAATDNLTALDHTHSHGPPREFTAEEATQIREEYDRQQQKLQRAAGGGKTASTVLWWAGMLSLVASAGLALFQRVLNEAE